VPALELPALCTTQEVLDALRLEADDPDADRVDSARLAAQSLLEQYLWRQEGLPPGAIEPLRQACIQVAIEQYRRKDSPFGVLDAWSPDGVGPVRIGNDPLAGAVQLVAPWRQGLGAR
jgi:hypothetical protein